MLKRQVLFYVVASCLATSSWGAKVSGVVKWNGAAPALQTINMDSDMNCKSKHSSEKGGPKSQALVLGSGNTVGNVFVRVKSGLPAGKTYDPPSTPAIITQEGCLYAPRVVGVLKGQDVKFLNHDGILHNVHALPKKNRPFNLSMPATMKESTPKKFKDEEFMFDVKCDVHPWMLAKVAVMDHPFFAVTSADGKFEIKDLPPGTYEIEAWHEKAGTKTAKVTVPASGDPGPVSFTFSK